MRLPTCTRSPHRKRGVHLRELDGLADRSKLGQPKQVDEAAVVSATLESPPARLTLLSLAGVPTRSD